MHGGAPAAAVALDKGGRRRAKEVLQTVRHDEDQLCYDTNCDMVCMPRRARRPNESIKFPMHRQ